ncbi:MAG: glycosyltransferase family 2 protein [Prosthecobacter sp.]|uniref:glycosyltransferase family 2 protein n=1 Tax=Prosthecobacter sp. TaxID=1965333 RepID=UPI0025D926ED|nr:glycosyltransferase family 2 protein [Prosthecobacter sp.]MCF7785105.1 glycosyltransferase family 2 protein [Prosthecobacter sp.]
MIFTAWFILMLSVAAVLHCYVFYPLWWRCFGARRPLLPVPPMQEEATLPLISVIVVGYNEAACIVRRIVNLQHCDYPADRLEIIIASDGSDDGSERLAAEVAGGDARVQLRHFAERRGKVAVLNEVCPQARGSILVLSDANVDFAPDTLRCLVARFQDAKVACVCGKLCFRTREGAAHTQSEGIYWKLETWLKQHEGGRGVLLGANGANYALRRELWTGCPPEIVVEDLFIPLQLLMQGWSVVFEPRALAYEDLPPALADEFGRRARIGAGDYQILARCLPLLHPSRGLAAWVFFSHKALRWVAPFFMLSAVVAGLVLLVLGAPGALLVGALGLCMLLLTVVGFSSLRLPGALGRLAAVSAYFVTMNAALLLGCLRWLRGGQQTTWKRTRRA